MDEKKINELLSNKNIDKTKSDINEIINEIDTMGLTFFFENQRITGKNNKATNKAPNKGTKIKFRILNI